MATAIKYGMKGDDVKNLQTTLNNSGYNLDVDGNFGSQTLDAVKDYQSKNNLTVDGMVGPQTSASLWGGTKTTTGLDLTNGNTTNKSTMEMKAGDTGTKELLGGTTSNTTSTSTGTNATGSGSSASGATNTGGGQPTYTYIDPSQSPNVQAANDQLTAILAQQPGAHKDTWETHLSDMIGRILNREEFSYDVNEDALYKQYAEQYKRGGQLAMQDTMGQAASMTGGYGNSYAASVGNQAYQEYMSKLNEVVPELYGMAYDRYQDEGEELYKQYGLLSDASDREYSRYMDKYNNWLTERGYYTDRLDTEYNKAVDERNFTYNDYRNLVGDKQWQMGFDETVKQNTINNEHWEKEYEQSDRHHNDTMESNAASENRKVALDSVYTAIENGVMPSNKDIEAAGLDPKYVQELYNSYEDKETETNSEKTKAEALDKIEMYISAGMEVPKVLLKQAGLSDDDLKALQGSYASSSSSSGATSSKALSSEEINEWSSAVLDAETEEDALMYIGQIEKIDPDFADYLWDKWQKEHGIGGAAIDTTVNTKPTYSGGGGGKILERAW